MSGDFLEIMPLGAGNEVGRSCIYLECKGRKIMLDCGIHPGKEGVQALPFFDVINPKELDLILVTHFHVDHCAGLPYFLQKTDFKGEVYMTHPTKAIYNYVMQDFVKVSNIAIDEKMFDEDDLKDSLNKIHMVDYHQEVEINGIKFSCYRAGHVLGASMFLIEIDGVKILYTGDYSREEDRHLKPAEFPNCEVDVLIVESTYGINVHDPRDSREEQFTRKVHEIVKGGGKCLLPVFALGRAQELLLILNEHWAKHPDIQHVPIYYSGSLAQKSLDVFQTFRNMMGDQLRLALESGNNPFKFEPITTFDDESPNPLVIMASPGMLQNGQSRDLFVKWAPDPKNGIVFTGYSVEGTLAKHVINGPATLLVNEQLVERKIQVESISFSAHADYEHTAQYIEQLQPPNIVLVHGDAKEMNKLQKNLQEKYQDKIKILTPKNCQQVRLKLISKKSAKIIGHLAKDIVMQSEKFVNRQSRQVQIERAISLQLKEDEEMEDLSNYITIDGIFVKQGFDHFVLDDMEIDKYTSLAKSTLKQTMYIPFKFDLNVLNYYLFTFFADVQVKYNNSHTKIPNGKQKKYQYKYTIEGIYLYYFDKAEIVEVKWVTSPKNDLIADSLSLMILQITQNPNPQVLKVMDGVKEGKAYQEFVEELDLIMNNACDLCEIDTTAQMMTVYQGPAIGYIDLKTRTVTCDDERFKERICKLVKELEDVHAPVCTKHL